MPVGKNTPRETAAERRARRKKMTGSEYKKTGTNRTVGKVVMTVTPKNAYPQSASAAPKKPKKKKKY